MPRRPLSFALRGLFGGFLVAASVARGAEIDVKAIVGLDTAAVGQVLGEAEFCQETYQGTACSYRGDTVEVVYIDRVADWVTFSGFDRLAFDHRAIARIGLIPGQPLVSNPFRMHWADLQGLAVVSVYGSGRYVAFIQVRAFTP